MTLMQSALPKQQMLVSGNQADVGGGIFNSGAGSSVTLGFGARVTKNHATVTGGGVYDECGAFLSLLPGAFFAFNTPNNLAFGC